MAKRSPLKFPEAPPGTDLAVGGAAGGTCDDLAVGTDAPLEPGGFVLGCRDKRRRLDLPRKLVTRHVMLLGPSGSGKSRGFFMENCARSTRASFIASDPKGELWDITSGRHPSPRRFAPRDPHASECFNWIPLCREPCGALRLARATVGEVAGHDGPQRELQVMLAAGLYSHAASLAAPTPASAFDLLTGLAPDGLVRALARSASAPARRYAAVAALADPRCLRTAALSLAARLVFLTDPDVRRFTSASREAPDFSALRREPTALYWIVREEDMGTMRPLAALFFTALLHACKQPDAAVPVTFFLDEFANICDVPDFETEITIARGRDIAFVLSIQSISQLERRYGAANAHTIYENCQTTIALPGLSNSSAELIARSLGAGDTRARLVTADDVRRLGDKEMVVIITNRPPLRLRRRKYEEPPAAAAARALGPALATRVRAGAER